jgi:NAD-dependent deacetylase
MEEEIKALRDTLKKADQVAVLTGAGISAESGVPTFRGDEDLRKAGEIVPKLVEAWG